MTLSESQFELDLLAKLSELKYSYRPDIRDRASLEANFREKFEALNRVKLTDSEFQRLLDSAITPDVYNAAQRLRTINSFERDDGTPSTARPEFYGGGIPFVSPADISDLRWVNDTKTTLTVWVLGKTRQVKANSVLFVCIGSTIGKVTQNVQDCATNQQINSVIPNAKHSGGFVYYILTLHAERIAKFAGIQAVPIINKTQFSAVRLLVPELQEQERIADCLASLDDLITAQSQKIDALKTHKKGLRQQLFPVLEEAQA